MTTPNQGVLCGYLFTRSLSQIHCWQALQATTEGIPRYSHHPGISTGAVWAEEVDEGLLEYQERRALGFCIKGMMIKNILFFKVTYKLLIYDFTS